MKLFVNGIFDYTNLLNKLKLLYFLGDFEITGNVTIRNFLEAENIFGNSVTYNIKKLIFDGLTTNTTNIDMILQFVQPIRVSNVTTESINGQNVSTWVQSNGIRTITGEKTFEGDLHITNGETEVAQVNNIILKKLDESVLKKFGDQTIKGNIRFESIDAQRFTTNFV